jgi:hypothetical protein
MTLWSAATSPSSARSWPHLRRRRCGQLHHLRLRWGLCGSSSSPPVASFFLTSIALPRPPPNNTNRPSHKGCAAPCPRRPGWSIGFSLLHGHKVNRSLNKIGVFYKTMTKKGWSRNSIRWINREIFKLDLISQMSTKSVERNGAFLCLFG